ncbi:hypothetical protein HanRHA438_Chr15g0712671 [Helianthus annuus]|nr:hypothetical protein HanRHA438_Chr15g0712671 [Helianthus annuus]
MTSVTVTDNANNRIELNRAHPYQRMSRLCPTKYVGVLSSDVLIKLKWVTIPNASALYILE